MTASMNCLKGSKSLNEQTDEQNEPKLGKVLAAEQLLEPANLKARLKCITEQIQKYFRLINSH